jgi:crotonobetainyl-CoA:carnitine CoA-transferase CaiB-like acyl-CoA transferase
MVLEKDGYKGIASPIKFSRSRDVGVASLPPRLGEHTYEVLRAAGLEESQIEVLIASGVIAQAEG